MITDDNKNNERENLSDADQSFSNSQDFSTDNTDSDSDTDKYLAMEQPGVSYTKESSATLSSDDMEIEGGTSGDKYRLDGRNSRNADAFSQDDYILRDNIDLDEDQNQSISAEENDK